MPSYKDHYGGSGQFLKADIVREQGLENKELIAKTVEPQEIGGKTKLVMQFTDSDYALVLNATNAQIMGDAFGEDYTTWPQKKIKLGLTKVKYEGKLVDSIQITPIIN